MKRGTAIVVTTALVAITAVLLMVLVVQLASSDPETSRIGDETFTVGRADRLEKRAPLLFQDLRGGDLHVWVNVVDGRWVTFRAFSEGCAVRQRGRTFVDCNGTSYPADGAGLQQFHTAVDKDGRVVVDFTRE